MVKYNPNKLYLFLTCEDQQTCDLFFDSLVYDWQSSFTYVVTSIIQCYTGKIKSFASPFDSSTIWNNFLCWICVFLHP